MKPFEDYIKRKIVRKCSVNKPKAKYFIEETDRTFKSLTKRVEALGIDDDNANSIIKDCYDILIELIRAKLLLSGFYASGLYAHESEISFMQKFGFFENEILFIDEIRASRNSITYHGKILNSEYAEKVVIFTKKMYPKLKKLVVEDIQN